MTKLRIVVCLLLRASALVGSTWALSLIQHKAEVGSLQAGLRNKSNGFACGDFKRACSNKQRDEVRGSGKPNLLFIMMDQLRFDGIAGATFPSYLQRTQSWTPNVDTLAADGVAFAHAYSSTPSCQPARAAILTGRSPWNHGMLGHGEIARAYKREMIQELAKAGYSTAVFGKNHYGYKESPTFSPYMHGFEVADLYEGMVKEHDDYYQWLRQETGNTPEMGWPTLDMNSWRGRPYAFDESLHPTAYVGNKSVEFLKHLDNSSNAQPWFVKVSFHRPHSPYDPPQRLLDSIKSETLPPVVVSSDGWDDRFKGNDSAGSDCGPSTLDAWCGKMPAADTEYARRAYRASIAFVDEQIGKLLDVVRERNFMERTFILFASDHGDCQGDHHHWRKSYAYECSARVPMIIRWPESFMKPAVSRGSAIESVIELRDIMPTMLHVAGAMPVDQTDVDGTSLLCLLYDPTGKTCPRGGWREFIDLEHATHLNETNNWNALTDGSTKYIFHAYSATEQLFNLETDPYELKDVSNEEQYQSTLVEWRSRMVNQFQSEKRGAQWVQNGKLMPRRWTLDAAVMYSPHFPDVPSALGAD